jgi:hypothetical protein
MWVSDCLSTLLVPISEFQHTPIPSKCCESGIVPQLFTFLLFSPQTHIWNLSKSLGACQRGFVVRNQTPNLTLDPFSTHLYSCISSLNGKCKVILNIYTFKKIQWYIGDPIWCLFALSTKILKIWDSRTSAIPKVGVKLRIIGLHLLHSPLFMIVFHTRTHFLGLMGFCIPHLAMNSMLGLQQ